MSKPVAYLGPKGTFTETVTSKIFPETESTAQPTIASVFQVIAAGNAELGVVPLENLREGPVTETLDLLQKYSGSIEIFRALVHPIRHAMGVLSAAGYGNLISGETPSSETIQKLISPNITAVYSHPQALKQCRERLSELFPAASQHITDSTAQAAHFITEHNNLKAVALAQREVLLSLGFDIISDDASDIPGNKTRFAIIRRSGTIVGEELLQEEVDGKLRWVTSFVLCPKKDRQGLLHDILTIISTKHKINLLAIHSRPDAQGGFVFYFELEGKLDTIEMSSCLADISHYCREETGDTAEISIFGCYNLAPFVEPTFKKVGIMGGLGRMGEWFRRFFEVINLHVSLFDSELSCSESIYLDELKLFLEDIDVLLVSIPISKISELGPIILSHIKPGTLVVENSSIKSAAKSILESAGELGVETLGIHTMFGPSVESMRGQNILVTKTATSGERADAFIDLLYKQGAKIFHTDTVSHDSSTAVTQSLLHMLLLAYAEVIRTQFPDTEALEPYTTPNLQATLRLLERITTQKDGLLQELQTLNPFASNSRALLLSVLQKLVEELSNDNSSHFLQLVHKTRSLVESLR